MENFNNNEEFGNWKNSFLIRDDKSFMWEHIDLIKDPDQEEMKFIFDESETNNND